MMSEVPPPQAEVRFRVADAFEVIRRRWPGARVGSHALGRGNDLTSEVLWAEPQQPDHWLVLTSGLHGIEGDLGAVMLDLFVREFAPRLDPRTTGIALVQPVNPWGMRRRRRTSRATLLGQYSHPRGVYFGGNERQQETKHLAKVSEKALMRSTRVVALDMHSGYGPRYQMTLVASS